MRLRRKGTTTNVQYACSLLCVLYQRHVCVGYGVRIKCKSAALTVRVGVFIPSVVLNNELGWTRATAIEVYLFLSQTFLAG